MLNAGNFREWSTITSNNPSNPQTQLDQIDDEAEYQLSGWDFPCVPIKWPPYCEWDGLFNQKMAGLPHYSVCDFAMFFLYAFGLAICSVGSFWVCSKKSAPQRKEPSGHPLSAQCAAPDSAVQGLPGRAMKELVTRFEGIELVGSWYSWTLSISLFFENSIHFARKIKELKWSSKLCRSFTNLLPKFQPLKSVSLVRSLQKKIYMERTAYLFRWNLGAWNMGLLVESLGSKVDSW